MAIHIPFQRIKTLLIKKYHYDSREPIHIDILSALEETKNYRSLCSLLKENFSYFCKEQILDGKIIDLASNMFNEQEIYHNKEISCGYVLISKSKKDQDVAKSVIEISGEATVVVKGYAHVNLSDRVRGYAFDNSTVRVYSDATLCAYNNSSISAFGNTNVIAFDNSIVRADSYSSVVSYDNASIRAMCKANVRAYGNSKLALMGLAVAIIYNNTVMVEAKGESYLSSNGKIDCKLREKALFHDLDSNTIYYSDENMQFMYTKKIDVE